MSSLIAGLAGAGGAAQNAGNYYTAAMQNEINAAGSPAATDFARLQMATLRPEITAQNNQLLGTLAATGLGGSGAGRSLGGNVASNEASTLAGVTAPLYQQALQGYSNINAQMPGAQEQAYSAAIQQFYQALSGAASTAGMFMGLPSGSPPMNYSGGLPSSSDIMGSQGYNPYAGATSGMDTGGMNQYGMPSGYY
jgi:hypothetical protein